MKKTFTLSVVALAFTACNNGTPQQTDNAAEEPTTPQQETLEGGDRDEHGCIGSAGYSWSALRGECIQVFEVGTRLNPVDVEQEEAVISAFIVCKEGDNSQVELFITGEDQNPILKKEAFILRTYEALPLCVTMSNNMRNTFLLNTILLQ